jgi:hypothetical protein
LDQIDHIVYATGNPPKIENVLCMKSILNDFPVESIGGLPQITHDLMWNEDVPMFLTGGLAGLTLGPGAANLAGARQGAERIAWKMDELFGSDNVPSARASGTEQQPRQQASSVNMDSYLTTERVLMQKSRSLMETQRSEFTGSFANQFEVLALQDRLSTGVNHENHENGA